MAELAARPWLAGAAEIRDHVYCRFFDGGAMVINANPNEEPVTEQDLEDAAVGQGLDWDAISGEEGHYYRFAGRQNPAFNDGSRFDEILLEGGTGAAGNTIGDGILLVRSPGRVVMAAVIIDTESCATSPSAQVASVEGFNGQCGDSGFRCGIGYCGETVPMWHYRSSGTGRGSRASFEVSMIHEDCPRGFSSSRPSLPIPVSGACTSLRTAGGEGYQEPDEQRRKGIRPGYCSRYRFTAA